MTSRSNTDETTDERVDGATEDTDDGTNGGRGRRLLRHAQQVADTGDRWFVSLAQGLGQIGTWARREKDVVAESAVAAAATTARVVKPLAWRLRPGTRPAPAADEEPAMQADPETWSAPAVSGDLAASEGPATEECAPAQSNPPGVLPVLEVLGKVVTDHESTQYSSLQSDNRFWALVRLLQSITPDGAATVVMANDQRPPGELTPAAHEREAPPRAAPATSPGLQLLRARTE